MTSLCCLCDNHGRNCTLGRFHSRIVNCRIANVLGIQVNERRLDSAKEVGVMIDEFTPAYSRSWTEIEWMLAEAQEQMYEQKSKFLHRKRVKDKDGCRRAAAKYARAKGMADVLLWVLGGPGVIDPMRGFEDVSESSSLQQFSS